MQDLFERFKQVKVLVIGDVMIDSYLWGKVDRISPEAPVPIVQVEKREKRLGGAANVALNVQALGATPVLCAVIGQDNDGEDFKQLLQQKQLSSEGILQSSDRVTTIKHRIIAGHQHILRVDSEIDTPLASALTDALFAQIQTLGSSCQVIIFEDYDKGVITPELIQKVVQWANAAGIPTVVDPKKRNFMEYEGVTLFKPNLKELKEGLKIDADLSQMPMLEQAVQLLMQKMGVAQVLATLSERGVLMKTAEGTWHIPAHIRTIADVSGAGDTVVSVAALCTALGCHPALTAALANLAGGLVCESVGVVSIDRDKLLEEALRQQLT